jgi:hypothetical protein
MCNAKFKVGSEVIIALPINNEQLKGHKVKIIDGPAKYRTEFGWTPGYAIKVGKQLFVAAESELEAA